METQFEANADTKIGSASTEHWITEWRLNLKLTRLQKRTLFKKVRSSVRYLKETIFFSNYKDLRLNYRAIS